MIMDPVRGLRRAPQPVALHDRAMENLRFIRETMERSAEFTAVSGWAGVAMGVVAMGAAWLAWGQSEPTAWISIWAAAAAISFLIAVAGMFVKSRTANLPLMSGPGRKFASSFAPPIFVGAVLTVALFLSGQSTLLPGIWLLLYGTAVVTGGAHSVRIIPLTGIAFIALGVAAVFAPAWGDAFMAAGFGGVHVLFGFLIARRHGG